METSVTKYIVMTPMDNSSDTSLDVSLGEDEPIPGTKLIDGSDQPSKRDLAEAPAGESL